MTHQSGHCTRFPTKLDKNQRSHLVLRNFGEFPRSDVDQTLVPTLVKFSAFISGSTFNKFKSIRISLTMIKAVTYFHKLLTSLIQNQTNMRVNIKRLAVFIKHIYINFRLDHI